MPIGAGTAAGAMSGAATGTAISPGWGTAIGAVAGGIMGSLGPGGPEARPFVNIPRSLQFAASNKLDKSLWKQMVAKYQGAPVNVLQKASQLKSGYGAGEAMSMGPEGGAYSGANNRVLASAQDAQAQGVNAATGWDLHKWALGGKLDSAAKRSEYAQAIDRLRMANAMHNAQLQGQYDAQQNALWAQAGQSAMGMMGGFNWGGGSPSAGTPNTVAGTPHTSGNVAPSGYNLAY